MFKFLKNIEIQCEYDKDDDDNNNNSRLPFQLMEHLECKRVQTKPIHEIGEATGQRNEQRVWNCYHAWNSEQTFHGLWQRSK